MRYEKSCLWGVEIESVEGSGRVCCETLFVFLKMYYISKNKIEYKQKEKSFLSAVY